MKFNQNGFSLVQVLVASAMMGGLALGMLQLVKNMGQIQTTTNASHDEMGLKNIVQLILENKDFCRLSLAGENPDLAPVNFRKSEIDGNPSTEGLPVELYFGNQVGSLRTTKKVSASDTTLSNYGLLKIESVKLIMNNGVGSNYATSTSHRDVGVLRILINKKNINGGPRTKTIDFDVSLSMKTNAGVTTILSCGAVSSSTAVTHKCYTIRRYEKNDHGYAFIGSMGQSLAAQDGLSLSQVTTMHGGCCTGTQEDQFVNNGMFAGTSPLPGQDVNDMYGIKCREDNDFYMQSCGHGSSEDQNDNDISMTSNGCFAGRNDGTKIRNFIDIRCCRFEEP